MKRALDHVPKDVTHREQMLLYAAGKCEALYDATKGSEELEAALALRAKVLDSLPKTFPYRRTSLIKLSELAFDRCMATRESRDIEMASLVLKNLLTYMPNYDPERRRMEHVLLEIIVAEMTELGLLDGAPSGDPSEGLFSRSGLAMIPKRRLDAHCEELLKRLFERQKSDSGEGTKEWIQKSEKALSRLSRDHPMREVELSSLGTSYLDLHEKTKLTEHLDNALRCFREGLDVDSTNEVMQKMLLAAIALHAWLKYDTTKSDKDRDAAIEATQKSLATGMNFLPDLWILGSQLLCRYNKKGDPADLDASLQMHQQALRLTPGGDPERSALLHGLGGVFYLRFERTGALLDLVEATVMARCP